VICHSSGNVVNEMTRRLRTFPSFQGERNYPGVIAVSARRIVNRLVSYLDDDQQATTDQMTTALLRHLPKPTGQEVSTSLTTPESTRISESEQPQDQTRLHCSPSLYPTISLVVQPLPPVGLVARSADLGLSPHHHPGSPTSHRPLSATAWYRGVAQTLGEMGLRVLVPG
jgi:hypothetical protein